MSADGKGGADGAAPASVDIVDLTMSDGEADGMVVAAAAPEGAILEVVQSKAPSEAPQPQKGGETDGEPEPPSTRDMASTRQRARPRSRGRTGKGGIKAPPSRSRRKRPAKRRRNDNKGGDADDDAEEEESDDDDKKEEEDDVEDAVGRGAYIPLTDAVYGKLDATNQGGPSNAYILCNVVNATSAENFRIPRDEVKTVEDLVCLLADLTEAGRHEIELVRDDGGRDLCMQIFNPYHQEDEHEEEVRKALAIELATQKQSAGRELTVEEAHEALKAKRAKLDAKLLSGRSQDLDHVIPRHIRSEASLLVCAYVDPRDVPRRAPSFSSYGHRFNTTSALLQVQLPVHHTYPCHKLKAVKVQYRLPHEVTWNKARVNWIEGSSMSHVTTTCTAEIRNLPSDHEVHARVRCVYKASYGKGRRGTARRKSNSDNSGTVDMASDWIEYEEVRSGVPMASFRTRAETRGGPDSRRRTRTAPSRSSSCAATCASSPSSIATSARKKKRARDQGPDVDRDESCLSRGSLGGGSDAEEREGEGDAESICSSGGSDSGWDDDGAEMEEEQQAQKQDAPALQLMLTQSTDQQQHAKSDEGPPGQQPSAQPKQEDDDLDHTQDYHQQQQKHASERSQHHQDQHQHQEHQEADQDQQTMPEPATCLVGGSGCNRPTKVVLPCGQCIYCDVCYDGNHVKIDSCTWCPKCRGPKEELLSIPVEKMSEAMAQRTCRKTGCGSVRNTARYFRCHSTFSCYCATCLDATGMGCLSCGEPGSDIFLWS